MDESMFPLPKCCSDFAFHDLSADHSRTVLCTSTRRTTGLLQCHVSNHFATDHDTLNQPLIRMYFVFRFRLTGIVLRIQRHSCLHCAFRHLVCFRKFRHLSCGNPSLVITVSIKKCCEYDHSTCHMRLSYIVHRQSCTTLLSLCIVNCPD